MSAMTPHTLSDLLECVAAFGRSLDERFDRARFLAEFSARSQRLVPHDYMLIALREDDGQTFSLFAEYAGRGGVGGDTRRYTTAFERGGRAATESFALAPVFGGEMEVIADMATDDRFGEASACRATLGEAGLRARLAVPLFAGGHVSGALVVMSAMAGMYTDAHASACRQIADCVGPVVETVVVLPRERRRRQRLAAATALAPILGASLKVGDVLEQLGEAIRPLIDFDTMGLALRAADGPGFERSGIIGVRRPGYATTPAVEDYSTLERVSRGEISSATLGVSWTPGARVTGTSSRAAIGQYSACRCCSVRSPAVGSSSSRRVSTGTTRATSRSAPRSPPRSCWQSSISGWPNTSNGLARRRRRRRSSSGRWRRCEPLSTTDSGSTRSSVGHRISSQLPTTHARWPPPVRQCCSPARAGPARRFWRGRSITRVREPRDHSSPSTALRCRKP